MMIVPSTILIACAVSSAGEPSTGAATSPPAQTLSSDRSTWQTLDADSQRPWFDAWGENLIYDIDLVARVRSSAQRGKASVFSTIGLDLRKVLSDSGGDAGTIVLQPYLARRDNASPMPSHVEDDDDWELELHQAWINLPLWNRGRGNLRLGHMLIPYGLEPYTDTHLTVRQVMTRLNLGAKMDWGVSLNGTLTRWDYEVAVLQGSGFELTKRARTTPSRPASEHRRIETSVSGFPAFTGRSSIHAACAAGAPGSHRPAVARRAPRHRTIPIPSWSAASAPEWTSPGSGGSSSLKARHPLAETSNRTSSTRYWNWGGSTSNRRSLLTHRFFTWVNAPCRDGIRTCRLDWV